MKATSRVLLTYLDLDDRISIRNLTNVVFSKAVKNSKDTDYRSVYYYLRDLMKLKMVDRDKHGRHHVYYLTNKGYKYKTKLKLNKDMTVNLTARKILRVVKDLSKVGVTELIKRGVNKDFLEVALRHLGRNGITSRVHSLDDTYSLVGDMDEYMSYGKANLRGHEHLILTILSEGAATVREVERLTGRASTIRLVHLGILHLDELTETLYIKEEWLNKGKDTTTTRTLSERIKSAMGRLATRHQDFIMA